MTIADTYAPARAKALSWWLYQIAAVAFGNALIALTAQLSILLPFSPVPVTGQTFGVLLTAAALGRVRGTIAVLAYLAEGLGGLPVFAGASAGAFHLFGPSGGYLLAFLPSAWLVGALAERGWDRSWYGTAAAMAFGSIIILSIGAAWLGTLVGWDRALAMGVYPFLAGDAVKIAIAAVVLPSARRLLRRDR